VERRAVEEAAIKAGAREVYPIEEPMAAAIGAGIPVEEPTGHMVVDIGGGTTEIAVTSLGGIVAGRSIRVAGNAMDKAIILYLRRAYSIVVGERTAEEIKIKIGNAFPEEDEELEIRGRNLVTGLPVNLVVHTREIHEAISEPLSEIVRAVKVTLEETKPEVASDIFENGVILTGGGALIKNIDKLLKHETNLPVFVAEEPLFSVARGTALVLEHHQMLKNLKSRKSKNR
jgi:rod shape-determining protein MreB